MLCALRVRYCIPFYVLPTYFVDGYFQTYPNDGYMRVPSLITALR